MKAILLIVTIVFGMPDDTTRAKIVVPNMFETIAECKAAQADVAVKVLGGAQLFAQAKNLTVKHAFSSCEDVSKVDYMEKASESSY